MHATNELQGLTKMLTYCTAKTLVEVLKGTMLPHNFHEQGPKDYSLTISKVHALDQRFTIHQRCAHAINCRLYVHTKTLIPAQILLLILILSIIQSLTLIPTLSSSF